MKEAELNRILTANQAQPAPHSSLSLRARLISDTKAEIKSGLGIRRAEHGVRPLLVSY